MAPLNWSRIENGETFESLVATLLFFEDSGAKLFGRRGPDGGQDARSGDGQRVFQAKHHGRGTAAQAISDALREVEKLRRYREPEHERYASWSTVVAWRLVTNVPFNPNDAQRWEEEVRPRFAELGLDADYWEQQVLNALLDKHPEVRRSYFEHETRLFLSASEARERVVHQEPFLGRLGPFCGRNAESQQVTAFLQSNQRFLVVHGAGGIGKTRFMLECAEDIASAGDFQVLWGQVESLRSAGTWFEAIVPERPTVLFLDKPDDAHFLRRLEEQVASGRAVAWKVVLAVQSAQDPVLGFLREARMSRRVSELALPRLAAIEGRDMCFGLFEMGTLRQRPAAEKLQVARAVTDQFSGHPVWITLAVRLLEDHGQVRALAETAEKLAAEYIEVVVENAGVPREAVRALLRWVALLGPVDRDDEQTIQQLAERCVQSADTIRELLQTLIERRALVARGARQRLVELKPDLLRDHVLQQWLTTRTRARRREASADASLLLAGLAKAATERRLWQTERRTLEAVARVEFLLRDSNVEVQLLDGFLNTVESRVAGTGWAQRQILNDNLRAVAQFRPRRAASVVRAIGSAPVDASRREEPDRESESALSVIRALADTLQEAAMGARSDDDRQAVFKELFELARSELECLTLGRVDSAPHVERVIAIVLAGGPAFEGDPALAGAFDEICLRLALDELDELRRLAPTPLREGLLRVVAAPLLENERRQEWLEDSCWRCRTLPVVPGTIPWSARATILARMQELLKSEGVPAGSRRAIWRVLARETWSPRYERLTWVLGVLSKHPADLSELVAARGIWRWELRSAAEPRTRQAAEALEELYRRNDLAREFEPLRGVFDRWTAPDDPTARLKAEELAAESSSGAIEAFLRRWEHFKAACSAEETRDVADLSAIAWHLGKEAGARDHAKQFILQGLNEEPGSPEWEFALQAAAGWVAALRASEPTRVLPLIAEFMERCGSDRGQVRLLLGLYRYRSDSVPAAERAMLRDRRALFVAPEDEADFVELIAPMAWIDWPIVRPMLEELVEQEHHRARVVQGLVHVLHLREAELAPERRNDLRSWLREQLRSARFADGLRGETKDGLLHILKRLGMSGVAWLADALRWRVEQEAKRAANRSRP